MAVNGEDYRDFKLTEEQKEHFMKYGYVKIPKCFTREKASEWTKDVWTRLGMSPTDKSTWTQERINMPFHRRELCQTFAPKAWAGICELLGGEERVAADSAMWSDGLIVNLGTPEFENKFPHPTELPGWHVDGDFFVHFLDSREQGLLVIPLFTDIKEGAGGTVICPDAIGKIAKHLYDHPEGVFPRMRPRYENENVSYYEDHTFYRETVKSCSIFHEMTGEIGDVVLLHPLMCHSASRNSLRIPRIITNPPVSLKEPFNFDRDDPSQYSLVEKKTLKELGKDRLPGWKIQAERAPVVPERLKVQAEMKKKELERMQGGLVTPSAA